MNIQAMMKQAQKMQKDMMDAKGKIDAMEFVCTKSFVTVKANGKKMITSINIDNDSLEKDDVEMLQDLLLVAVNDVMKQIDDETEKQLGKYTQGMPGLF